jgi:hypothetical protein
MEDRTRLYTAAGITAELAPDGRAEMVDRLRLMVIRPDRETEFRRPEVSLASNDAVMGLYRARE